MEVLSRQDVSTGKIFANIILTKEEVEKLIAGGVVSGQEPQLAIQIVGYGDEIKKEFC